MSEQRRLAAILVADVVGYSKLIGSDEAGTLAKLQTLRTEIIEPQIAKHAGRLFKSVGDGFLIEFARAVQAVSCVKAIQGKLQAANESEVLTLIQDEFDLADEPGWSARDKADLRRALLDANFVQLELLFLVDYGRACCSGANPGTPDG